MNAGFSPVRLLGQPILLDMRRILLTILALTVMSTGVLAKSFVVQAAYRNLGARYVWGASRPGAFDCSGFTMYVMRQFGVSLPHSSSAQSRMGRSVSRSNLQPGDLMFFSSGTRGVVGHVGIYIGNGRMIHASTPSTGVIVSSINESYFAARYLGARRVM